MEACPLCNGAAAARDACGRCGGDGVVQMRPQRCPWCHAGRRILNSRSYEAFNLGWIMFSCGAGYERDGTPLPGDGYECARVTPEIAAIVHDIIAERGHRALSLIERDPEVASLLGAIRG
jgi:hypothetical protein